MSYRTTIIVSPRERFSSVIASLESLFATIDPAVPVIVVEGGSPPQVKDQLKAMQSRRTFEWVSLDYMVIPNEARNIGGRMAKTEFVVFADNDIDYQPNWLERLEANADEHGSDAVAPLIFIGPSKDNLIHHAGGSLVLEERGGKVILREKHRLMNEPIAKVEAELDALAPVENEVCEFHLTFMRREFFERLGGFDERLITREQMDFGLRIKDLNAKITFEKNARVTYMAFEPFNPIDLEYHLFRWSDWRAVESIEVFEKTWGIPLNHKAIRYHWIEQHRDRAWASANPKAKVMGRHIYRKLFANQAEKELNERTEQIRPQVAPFVPAAPNRDARTLFGLS